MRRRACLLALSPVWFGILSLCMVAPSLIWASFCSRLSIELRSIEPIIRLNEHLLRKGALNFFFGGLCNRWSALILATRTSRLEGAIDKRVATVLEPSGSYYDGPRGHVWTIWVWKPGIPGPPKMAISNGEILINQWILRYLDVLGTLFSGTAIHQKDALDTR